MTEIDVKIETGRVIKAMLEQAELGLEAIGATAQGYAVQDTPVDTGRLRNSITWATKNNMTAKGNKRQGDKATAADMKAKAEPEELSVAIGTNVEYAVWVEYLTRRHKSGKAHYLRDAVTTHGEEYKKIMEAALKD